MKQRNFIAVAVLVAIMAGCDNKPTCADLPTIKDPVQRAEVLKRCPRGEPGGFKPTYKKEW
ncbi:entry exclusion lipoprotein TrbK [compost metagenome]